MTEKRYGKINVHLANTEGVGALQLILRYESLARSRSMGQTAYDMVLQSANLSEYPSDLQERLDEIEAEIRNRALEASLKELG